ncbi:DEAD/DEAH box helicase [Oscillibacter sp.]|uniref:DEAD/DEAH box helicase n=1 Tax=Oscillibacter sp. TaxID=1945593 RepID=UPI002637B700|nr:DEAD/DEAH box helicase [Oscillibacter sp.]MDD3347317.1 DEAD/DEAH box helicase [Oscillibacter sp.]
MTFEQLQLSQPLLAAISRQGYIEPTPIQQQAIPYLLEKRDLIGCAQTGTGKTAAFALPILQILSKERAKQVRALILTPTRELAIQILDCFQSYGENLPLRSAAIFGGVGQEPQVAALRRGVDILIATPGRLCDLMQQGYVKLAGLEIFVLDEADRMLDMGFLRDVKKVLAALPKQRQTLLFSATMPREIETLAHTMLHAPVTVKANPVTDTATAVQQSVYLIDKKNKKFLLQNLLKQGVTSALVFTRTKYGANDVVKDLAKAGIEAMAIHGNKSQTARQTALSSFKSGKIKVLVATDIAARGIDVPELSHVINYELPNEPETYIHRVGRTGRAGLGGIAISFCDYDELDYLEDIEKLTGKALPRETSKWPMEVLQKTVKQPRTAPGTNRRRTAAPSVKLRGDKQDAPKRQPSAARGARTEKRGRRHP